MDTDFYADMQLTAIEALEEYGVDALVVKATKPVYSPTTGTITSTSATFSVKAVVYPWKKKYINHEQGIDAGRSELSAIIGTRETNLSIAQGDRLSISGQQYVFEEVSRVAPGGIDLIWIGKVSA